MKIDKELLDSLFEHARNNSRQRQSYDLRTSSQRMLDALLPGSAVPINKHPNSSENVICVCGRLEEGIYNEDGT